MNYNCLIIIIIITIIIIIIIIIIRFYGLKLVEKLLHLINEFFFSFKQN